MPLCDACQFFYGTCVIDVNRHDASILSPTIKCLAFDKNISFAIVTAGYQKSWHLTKGVHARALLMDNCTLIFYRTQVGSEEIEILTVFKINETCRVQLLDSTSNTKLDFQPFSVGKFCLHLLANQPGKEIASFIIAFSNQYKLEDWFVALDRIITPVRPTVPPKTYRKGANTEPDTKNSYCIIA